MPCMPLWGLRSPRPPDKRRATARRLRFSLVAVPEAEGLSPKMIGRKYAPLDQEARSILIAAATYNVFTSYCNQTYKRDNYESHKKFERASAGKSL
ncbi:hypothetical protein F4776DRAFT_669042 [Hypoxylon sp. NC0597]|nr:hypothetical protein F4776DRAFT_669042 [Hypoxylon sp. NC0597]